MNVDCWFHIASFCDIKERGRLFVAHKTIQRDWRDLQLYYLQTNEVPLSQIVHRDWVFLQRVALMSTHQLRLPNGQATTCWTPWCPGDDIGLRRRFLSLTFKNEYNEEHRLFIQWIRKLACGRYVHTKALHVCYRWRRQWQIPTRNGFQNILFNLPHEVRARVRVLRLPYPIVERGRLILDVQEFETT